jgi:hypothetical protein
VLTEFYSGSSKNTLANPKTLRNRSSSRSNIHQHAQNHGNRTQNVKESLYPQRSNTPPPLPKSVSLPLHTKKEKGTANTIIPVVSVNVVDPAHDSTTAGSSGEWSSNRNFRVLISCAQMDRNNSIIIFFTNHQYIDLFLVSLLVALYWRTHL